MLSSGIKNPPMSVVMAAYNHGKYIGEAIQSVLDQTFGDFELIVFDDGSIDNTRDVVSAFSDKRIRYHYQVNSGLPACGRNKGMKLSVGKYISLFDADDVWYKEKLQKSKEILDAMPEVGLVCHNEAIVHDGRIMRNTSFGPYRFDMYRQLLFKGNCLHSSAVTLRRKIVFDDGLEFSEDKQLFTVEDYEYWMRLSKKYRFFFLPDVLGYYRVTDTGAFLSSGSANPLNMLRLLDVHFKEMGEPDKETKKLIRKRRSTVMCSGGRICLHKGEFEESARWYRMALRELPFGYKALLGLLTSLLRIKVVFR